MQSKSELQSNELVVEWARAIILNAEADSHRRSSIKKAVTVGVLFKKAVVITSQYSQKNTCFGVSSSLTRCSFIKKRLQCWRFLYIANLLRTVILKNIYEQLLLPMQKKSSSERLFLIVILKNDFFSLRFILSFVLTTPLPCTA